MISGVVSKLGVDAVVVLVFLAMVFQLPFLGFALWFIERQRSSESDLNRQINGQFFDALQQNRDALTAFSGRLENVLGVLEKILVAVSKRGVR